MKRLRELENENSRLKKIVANLPLDKEMLQDVLKRKLYGLLGNGCWSTRSGLTGRSIRIACPLIRFDRRTYRYKSRRPDQTTKKQRIKEIFLTRVRFGYRRVHVLLRRQGWQVNWKKFKEEGLRVRKRRGRTRALATKSPRAILQRQNQRWGLGLVSDCLSCGRRFRILNVIDNFSQKCLAALVDTSLSVSGLAGRWTGSPRYGATLA